MSERFREQLDRLEQVGSVGLRDVARLLCLVGATVDALLEEIRADRAPAAANETEEQHDD